MSWAAIPGNHAWAEIDECERQCLLCGETCFADADGYPMTDAQAAEQAAFWPRYSYSLKADRSLDTDDRIRP